MSIKSQNFFYLFAALLFLVLLIPLYRDFVGTDPLRLSELAFSAFLIIGIWSLSQSRRWFLVAIVLATIGIASNVLAFRGGNTGFAIASLIAYTAFVLLSTALATRQVFASRSIELNNIIGALCIYLLLAVIWALFYTLVNVMLPGSFDGSADGSAHQQLIDFIYFSMVTLTSLGYGDITPLGATARALATLEVLFGQFYIAVMVAGLVAAYLKTESRH